MNYADMQAAIQNYIVTDWKDFNANCDGEYKYYNGLFSDFLDEYTQNVLRLSELQKMQQQILSSASFLSSNNGVGGSLLQGITTSSNVSSAANMSDADKKALNEAGVAWNKAYELLQKTGNQKYQQEMDKAHAQAEAIRAKYGFSGGDDGSGYIIKDAELFAQYQTSTSKTEDAIISNLNKYLNNLNGNYAYEQQLGDYRLNNATEDLGQHQANLEQQVIINSDIISDWVTYNGDSKVQYDLQTMQFQDFLETYEQQIQEYANLQSQMASLQSGGGSGSVGGSDKSMWTSKDWVNYRTEHVDLTGYPSKPAQDISDNAWKDYVDSGGKVPSSSTSGGKGSSSGKGSAGGGSSKGSGTGSAGGGSSGKKSYSTGIENGPVTYTGLATLHGSPSEPEYVLNNDQAYTLLKNMSTVKMAEYESTVDKETGDIYNLYGDINLEDVNNPAEFWNAVMNSAGNKWNVTKNRTKR